MQAFESQALKNLSIVVKTIKTLTITVLYYLNGATKFTIFKQ